MSFGHLHRLQRTARIAYSRHPVAWLYRTWRYFSDDGEDEFGDGQVNVLLLPLTLLALTVLLVMTVPGASDAVAATCATACMP